jgi:hypothetical protein
LAHCNKKKKRVGLVRHPQLINMEQNNKYPQVYKGGYQVGCSSQGVLAQAKNGDKLDPTCCI